MKLLLTGFEPFGGSPVNPSEQVVRTLAAEGFEGVRLQMAVLPVDRVHGPAALLRAVRQGGPDVVLALGEASRRAAISVERAAHNWMDYRIADNAGQRVVDEPIVPGGPSAYVTTLPARALVEAIWAAGVPAELSSSAGTFLCNQVLYTLLHHVEQNGLSMRAGFIHLPRLPEQVIGQEAPAPSMSLEAMLVGTRAAVETIKNTYPEMS